MPRQWPLLCICLSAVAFWLIAVLWFQMLGIAGDGTHPTPWSFDMVWHSAALLPFAVLLAVLSAAIWRRVYSRDLSQGEARVAKLENSREALERDYAQMLDSRERIEEQAEASIRIAEELSIARDAIKESEQRYKTLAEVIQVGIWQITEDGRTQYTNPPTREIIGRDTMEDGEDCAFQDLLASDEFGSLGDAFEAWRHGSRSRCEIRIAGTRPGHHRDIDMVGSPLVDESGHVRSILITLTDITERNQADAVKWKMAHTDPLTGLPNRQLFRDRRDDAVKNAQRLGTRAALMFLDLDHFKDINDSHGHPIGDKLLRLVSKELTGAVRETDTVARLGGDEFAVIITHLEDDKRLSMLAQRIIDKVSQPRVIDDCFVKAGTSIGICFCPLDGTDPDELIRKADHALYQAKADGRNCYHVYDKALHARIASMAALESELSQALDLEEFVLHYQPQYDITGTHVIGAEALIRWNHPQRGFLYPGDFIPVAESSGLVIPMGKWALATACRQNKAWQDQGLPPFRVSVNVAACQFQTEDFVASVEHALARSGLEARWLEVEITESMMLSDTPEGMDEIIEKLGRLRETGVEIAVDDFGTGYSSLSYLRLLPINRLKIDRSFVENIDTDSSSAAIVATVIGLAHSLGLKAIAEGVETAAQHAVLDDQGCDEIQGFLLGRPQSAEKFVRWISNPMPMQTARRG